MENYYEILQCNAESPPEEIKNAYQRLVLKFHPDKQKQRENNITEIGEATDTSAEFIHIKKAWDILGDENLRKEFDARWKQRCIAQNWPVQDEVEFEDFDVLQIGSAISYTHSCRCGGEYVLSQTDADFNMDYVNCAYCSLCVKVVYPSGEECSEASS